MVVCPLPDNRKRGQYSSLFLFPGGEARVPYRGVWGSPPGNKYFLGTKLTFCVQVIDKMSEGS